LCIISLLIKKLAIKQEGLNQSYEYSIKNDRVAGEKPFLNQGKKAESDEKPARGRNGSSISLCRFAQVHSIPWTSRSPALISISSLHQFLHHCGIQSHHIYSISSMVLFPGISMIDLKFKVGPDIFLRHLQELL
jgi:hypothetical protein